MTRQEQYNKRSLDFSIWIRENLPDSNTGFCVTNQDWVFYNWKTKRLMLAEEKTNFGHVSSWFLRLINEIIHPALLEYCPNHNIDYRGYHIIKFENSSPNDGRISLDALGRNVKKIVTQEQLKLFLGMED